MLPASHPTQEHVISTLVIGLNYAPEQTGIAPYTAGMAERMVADGHAISVLTTFPHYPEWRFTEGAPPATSDTIVNGVPVRRLRHRLPKPGSSVSRVLSELSFGVRALFSRWGRPESVVLVSPALFASAILVPRLVLQRVPFVVWVQDLYGLGVEEIGGGKAGLAGRLVGRLEGWLLRRADSVIVIQEHMAATVLRLGVSHERLSVVRNWTHLAEMPDIDRDEVRRSLGWREDETIVLHTGNMGVKQHLRNVVDTARLADAVGADVRFVLTGDGTERAALEAAAADIARIEMLPPQPAFEYQQMLQAADVLLVNEAPGLRGAVLPSKLTSYFASGRPVLAATHEDSATAAELRRASAGMQVAAGSPTDLLRAVGQLTRDPELMHSLASAGLAYRREVLSVDGAAASFGRVLSELPPRHAMRATVPLSTVPTQVVLGRDIASAGAQAHHWRGRR